MNPLLPLFAFLLSLLALLVAYGVVRVVLVLRDLSARQSVALSGVSA